MTLLLSAVDVLAQAGNHTQVLAIMPWVMLILQILWAKVMPFIGVLAIVAYGIIRNGHKIPVSSVQEKLGRRVIGRGSRILGRTLIAIKDEDGLWSIKPATYDKENQGYWVPTSDGREFYDAAGVGGDPGSWYGGTNLAVAYDGLGALAEAASAEVGRQARIKKQTYKEDLPPASKAGETGKQLIATAKDEILASLAGDDESDPLADGGVATADAAADDDGEATVVEEWDTLLPSKKVVDLRDTIYAAPFHVQPQQFHRVAENAKAGQKGFGDLGPLGQAGVIMTAFILGAIACYIGLQAGGGGGGGGVTVPMQVAAVVGVV